MGAIIPNNRAFTADNRFLVYGSVVFGNEGQKPDPENPGTLKQIFIDQEETTPAQNPQPLDGDAKFQQGGSTGKLFGSGIYSVLVLDSNGVEQAYMPSYSVIDNQTAQEAAEAAEAAQAAAEAAAEGITVPAGSSITLSVETITDLRALEPLFDGQQVSLSGYNPTVAPDLPVGGGIFTAKYGNYSAEVTKDALTRVYVAFPSDPTGATGAWVADIQTNRNIYIRQYHSISDLTDSPVTSADEHSIAEAFNSLDGNTEVELRRYRVILTSNVQPDMLGVIQSSFDASISYQPINTYQAGRFTGTATDDQGSPDAVFTVQRAQGGENSPHSFRDNTDWTPVGAGEPAMASYDADADVYDNVNTDHFIDYQSRGRKFGTGTVGTWWGFATAARIDAGHVVNFKAFENNGRISPDATCTTYTSFESEPQVYGDTSTVTHFQARELAKLPTTTIGAEIGYYCKSLEGALPENTYPILIEPQPAGVRNLIQCKTDYTDDVEITAKTKGVVLSSPNGTRYRIVVSDAGDISATAV